MCYRRGKCGAADVRAALTKRGASIEGGNERSLLERLARSYRLDEVTENLTALKMETHLLNESEHEREQRLALEQNTIDFWHWADGAQISGASHVMYTFGLMADHHKMVVSHDSEHYCNEARMLLFMPMGDCGKSLMFMQGYIVNGTEALGEGITLLDGTKLRLRFRFLKGDAPIQQKMASVTGGNATWRCWLCPTPIDDFPNLVASREGVALRDVNRAFKIGEMCACIDGCKSQIHVRDLRVREQRQVAQKLGVSTAGTQRTAEGVEYRWRGECKFGVLRGLGDLREPNGDM
jgi:hypothetical protein